MSEGDIPTLNRTTLVYRAPDSIPHFCELKNYVHLPEHTVVRCNVCGTYWERHSAVRDWSISSWRKVRWWNRAARRRIADGEGRR